MGSVAYIILWLVNCDRWKEVNFKHFCVKDYAHNRVQCLNEEMLYYKKIAEQCVQQLMLTGDVRYSEERNCYYWVSTGQEVGEE